ncbi:hypothetical protein PoB_001564400 [Plakobranchus ocellatus]|uniref:Uncharacterized protein n=1 Tax=Plakobranchus ocellatus TaxID=259542 RepID=A0AAV3Z541_9GAST|nr:hypothetical protein PoB_001564400 [Plakobranchus ocellatus]
MLSGEKRSWHTNEQFQARQLREGIIWSLVAAKLAQLHLKTVSTRTRTTRTRTTTTTTRRTRTTTTTTTRTTTTTNEDFHQHQQHNYDKNPQTLHSDHFATSELGFRTHSVGRQQRVSEMFGFDPVTQ